MPTYPEVIGARLRARREQLGLTGLAFASRVGVSRQAVSRWELGIDRPHIDRQREIANALGCEWSDLFDPAESAS